MSQETSLRRSVQVVRRQKILVASVIALGLLGGVAYATLNPPKLSSQALVVLPAAGQTMPTEVVIAGSDPVLSATLRRIGPGTSLGALRNEVSIHSLTSNVMAITARGKNAQEAEATANAVANSYLAYLSSPASPVGHVPAQLLQSATSATGTTAAKQTILFALLGALAGLIVGCIAALVRGRGDRRLRQRDEIANAIGVPVLASVPVERPTDAPGWTKLLVDYEPSVVHAWRLRSVLQQLGVTNVAPLKGARDPFSVTVLSLSSDRRALALGPQLAVFAASLGIPTALVVGPQQDTSVTAALRTACGGPLPGSSDQARPLWVIAPENGDAPDAQGAVLVVTVLVIDSRTPQVPEAMRTATTLLGVSAGAVTAEQLARAAMVAVGDDRAITGILVADPEAADQTTGRIPQLGRAVQRRAPTRVNGIPTESRR
jgi:capsular polysaccharide biosynthesis protein